MKTTKFLILLAMILLISCDKPNENLIVGKYGIDKYRIRDTSINVDVYTHLFINTDKTFELSNIGGTKKGSWYIQHLSYKKNDNGGTELRGEIFFLLNDKSTKAELKGNIIEFTFPNDFYLGKYETLLYVKTN